MKLFYAYSKSVRTSVFIVFLLYQSSQNLQAQCSSCSDGPSEGVVEACDDFESSTVGQILPLEKNSWRPWGGLLTFQPSSASTDRR